VDIGAFSAIIYTKGKNRLKKRVYIYMKSFRHFLKLMEASADSKAFMKYLKAYPLNKKWDDKFRNSSPYHIRFPVDGDDDKVATFWKDLGIMCMHDPDKDISGTFKSYLLTASDKMPDSDGSLAGVELWYVNNSRKASSGGADVITDKGLMPKNFSGIPGLTGKLKDIKKHVASHLEVAYDKPVSEYLMSLFELASKTSGREATIDFDIGLSKGDLRRISKDYGEILGAAWALKTKEIQADSIFFPAAGNEPLVDFYTVDSDGKIGYSVKSGKGSGSSIANIATGLETRSGDSDWLKQFSKGEQDTIKLIVHMNKVSIMQGIIDANIAMGTPGIKALADAMGISRPQKRSFEGGITVEQIALWLNTFPTLEKKYEAAQKLYKVFGGGGTTWRIWKRLENKNHQAAAIINPLGYHVVSYLNDAGQDTLNKAVKALQVLQLDCNVLKNKMTFSVKHFKDMNFEFEHHGSIKGVGIGNRLGFKKKR